MADVAQQRFHAASLTARSVEADIVRQHVRHRAESSTEDDAKGIGRQSQNSNSTPSAFSLEPVSRLPGQIRVGVPLDSPYTLRVDRLRQYSSSGSLDQDRGRLMVVATLVSADENGSSTPLDPGTLTGPRLADTVHPAPSPGILGEVSFPELAIQTAGTFRIRVTLLMMNAMAHGGGMTSGSQGATSLVSLDSEPVVVES